MDILRAIVDVIVVMCLCYAVPRLVAQGIVEGIRAGEPTSRRLPGGGNR